MDDEAPPGGAIMKFAAMAAAIPKAGKAGEGVPIVRLTFTAMALCSEWDEVDPFFTKAHRHIARSFEEKVTDEVRAEWGEQW
jgi:hypothetical protein